MAFLAVKHHFCSTTAQYSVLHSLNDSVACGIFLGHGSNPGPLHCEAASSPLAHQGRGENMGIDMQILTKFPGHFQEDGH